MQHTVFYIQRLIFTGLMGSEFHSLHSTKFRFCCENEGVMKNWPWWIVKSYGDFSFQQSSSFFMIFACVLQTYFWKWPFNGKNIIKLLGFFEIHVGSLICSAYLSLCKYNYKRFHLYIRPVISWIFSLFQ